MHTYISEFLGTMILIILGDGVVANCTLNKSAMKGSGSVQITWAWGFAVMIPAYIFDNSSGALFNPALTIALAIDGSISWSVVVPYIIAQILGAFVGACIMWLMFMDHFNATDDEKVILGCFATTPSIRNIPRNIFCEAVASFILVFSIKGISQVTDLAHGLKTAYLFGIIAAIGMSLGGLTGYAINPARDLGPRLAHQLLPIKHKGSSGWDYAFVPIVGSLIGSIGAVLLYKVLF